MFLLLSPFLTSILMLHITITNNLDSSLLIKSSHCDNCLANVFSLQHPHKSSWHVFKAFCDVFGTTQFALFQPSHQSFEGFWVLVLPPVLHEALHLKLLEDHG